jgi:hypothetical protein
MMCNPIPNSSSASPFLCPTQTHLITPNPKLLINVPPPHHQVKHQDHELHRWPTPNEVNVKKNIFKKYKKIIK